MSAPLSLPSGWPGSVCDAVLHVMAMAHLALTHTRSWAANSPLERVRLKARASELEQEVALLREELRIKDARMMRMSPPKRPRYPPAEPLAILAVRATRRWSLARTARAFLVTEQTIRCWMRRLGADGPGALVQVPMPVNRFADFVGVVVQQLRVTCPSLGKVRIAQMLSRAGLVLSASTAGRMLERATTETPEPEPTRSGKKRDAAGGVLTARHPHHVWHVDMTVVPTACGFWVPWLPKVLAQRWPFGAWVAVVMDHFSRSIVGRGVFDRQPTAREVCGMLEQSVRDAAAAPRHIISDQGPQFGAKYRAWCESRGAKPRFGAIGQHGSIAVIERFMRSLKDEAMRRVVLPLSVPKIERELNAYLLWYDEYRPHQSLGGRTPGEVLRGEGREHGERIRAHHAPRDRERAPLRLVVSHVEGRRHLRGGHAPASEAAAHLLDHSLLVAALANLIDHVGSAEVARQVRDDPCVLVVIEEVRLAFAVFDEFSTHDESVDVLLAGRSVCRLCDPLLGLEPFVVAPLSSSLSSPIALLAARLVARSAAALLALPLCTRLERTERLFG